MITRVAIRFNGIIFTGLQNQRHSDVIRIIFESINGPIPSLNLLQAQGFVDEYGNFLTRGEAAKHAFDCGQLPNDKTCPDTLISEDLW